MIPSRIFLILFCAIAIVGCGGGGGGDSDASQDRAALRTATVTLADAGVQQNVLAGTTVTLSGAASSVANNRTLTYVWTLKSKPGSSIATLSNSTVVSPTFVADFAGSYTFELVVNDGKTTSAPASVTVVATQGNALPVADAGTPQNVLTGTTVNLNGAASSDANGDSITYAWSFISQPTGSTSTLSNANSVNPAFAPNVAGSYVLGLVVNDGTVNSARSTVTITVATNVAPVANAGVAQNVITGSTVTLNGAASSDANGDNLTYIWSITSQPTGSAAALSSIYTVNPSFVPLVSGTYVLRLVVNDGHDSSFPSTVTITVANANVAPVANAGVAQNVVTGSTVTLNGAASSDANGDNLTYAWTFVSKPIGSTSTIANPSSVNPTFIPNAAGSYVLSLVVNDGKTNSAATTVTITVANANVAPVANAGTAQNVLVGSTVALSGAASSDANGDSLTYSWSFTSKPVGSTSILSNTSSVNPSFVPNAAGSYVLNLVVNDGKVSSAASTVTITAAVANVAPVSNAGTAQNAVVGSIVALSGAASSDANSDTLTYTWGFTSKPSGSTATLSNAAIVNPTFVPDLGGSYVLNVVVSDGQLSSTASTVTITASVASGVISASVSASRIGGVAPLSVFFDASGTTSTGTSKPFHDLEYRWDFGDTSSGTWNVGSRTGASRNVARGPMASHVFETPGVYTVTMVATDGTNAPVNTVQVTVSDPNTVFAANTICFSTSGTFTGCPAGAAQQTTSDFAAAVNNNQATKKRLLFRRGETWSASGAARITSTGPGIVGAFGSGAAPKWTIATSNAALYLSNQSTAGIKDWRVMDIEMDGQNRFTAGVSGDGGMDQALLLRLNIHNVSNAIVMSAAILDYENTDGNAAHGGHTVWDQFAVVDTRVNTINGGVGSGGMIGAYISAARFTFMGNDFDSAGGGEHVLRTPYIGRGVVSNNYMGRPDATKHCWQFHAPGQSQTGVTGGGRYTEKVVASENTFFGGAAAWAVFVGPQNTGVDERLRNIIFERNYFKAGTGTSVAMSMRGPISAISIRNNIANMSGSTGGGATGFDVGDGSAGPVPTTISYFNNTIYGTGTGQLNGLTIGSTPINISVRNNLAYAPNASATYMLIGTGASGLISSNNSSNAAMRTSPSFATLPSGNSLTTTDFKIGSGSYAALSGALLPVLSDFFQTSTSLVAPDMGAVAH